MLKINIKDINDDYFTLAWQLYEDAFPKYERRTLEAQSKLFGNPSYQFNVFVDKNEFVGFVLWWDFKNYQYIDHIAVAQPLRSKGYGAKILEEFINEVSKPIVLEVELPDSSINRRRIEFYERLGFKLNLHQYKVPSSIDDGKIDLLVMTYPKLISKEGLNEFVSNNHPIIFNSFQSL